jgi:hypothetical protein
MNKLLKLRERLNVWIDADKNEAAVFLILFASVFGTQVLIYNVSAWFILVYLGMLLMRWPVVRS